MRADDTDDGNDDHEVKQEGAQIITGLQQDPYRSDRSDRDINTQKDHPGLVGQVDRMPVEAKDNNSDDTNDADDRGNADACMTAVNGKTEDDGQQDEEQRNHRCRSVSRACDLINDTGIGVGCLKSAGYNSRKGCNDHQCENRVPQCVMISLLIFFTPQLGPEVIGGDILKMSFPLHSRRPSRIIGNPSTDMLGVGLRSFAAN